MAKRSAESQWAPTYESYESESESESGQRGHISEREYQRLESARNQLPTKAKRWLGYIQSFDNEFDEEYHGIEPHHGLVRRQHCVTQKSYADVLPYRYWARIVERWYDGSGSAPGDASEYPGLTYVDAAALGPKVSSEELRWTQKWQEVVAAKNEPPGKRPRGGQGHDPPIDWSQVPA